MYAGHKVLDIHGHVTAPPQFRNYAMTLMTQRNPRNAPLRLSDEQLDGALNQHIKGLDARNIDVQILTQRPVAMLQWEMEHVQAQWCGGLGREPEEGTLVLARLFPGWCKVRAEVRLES